eukprot:COSAG06_NODE_1025_length_11037_cov_3.414518_6_plen_211_part_00
MAQKDRFNSPFAGWWRPDGRVVSTPPAATASGGEGGSSSAVVPMFALCLYMMSFSLGMGPGAWLIPSEVLRKNHAYLLRRHFIAIKYDHLTKTGSGQTQGKHSQREACFLAGVLQRSPRQGDVNGNGGESSGCVLYEFGRNSVVIRSYRGTCVAATDLWRVAATGLCDAAATFMASSFLTLADWLTYSGVLTFFALLTVRKTPFSPLEPF